MLRVARPGNSKQTVLKLRRYSQDQTGQVKRRDSPVLSVHHWAVNVKDQQPITEHGGRFVIQPVEG